MRAILEADPPSRYLYQVCLAERRVAYFAMRNAIRSGAGQSIRYFELADSKPSDEGSGFHHVEVFPRSMTYDQLIQHLTRQGETPVLRVRAHHTTHDIKVAENFIVRLTYRPLLKTILEEELTKDV
jgi:hypothetical protein